MSIWPTLTKTCRARQLLFWISHVYPSLCTCIRAKTDASTVFEREPHFEEDQPLCETTTRTSIFSLIQGGGESACLNVQHWQWHTSESTFSLYWNTVHAYHTCTAGWEETNNHAVLTNTENYRQNCTSTSKCEHYIFIPRQIIASLIAL